ncbi:oxidized low-density lipoprotein receptor 1-like [Schistocerca serialis cubense]|uniref:oxidized low-density lipoprotein receptor 1-like n=1 Tax=Schistocerca serialis cubense TaxID=2023355 RepID=UPI00214E9854|nr:oxidized low-density lipoprotein receptor 1-like [Schistocerca serialis cubense]
MVFFSRIHIWLTLLVAIPSTKSNDEETASGQDWDPELQGLITPLLESLVAVTGTHRGQKVMRVPPTRDVSETDLYLLGAIEKLAYRLDFMDKRIRRVEELIYYVMDSAGQHANQGKDPCPRNFTRIKNNCYHFSNNQLNWKAANSACKGLDSNLAEFETIEENQDIVTSILAHKEYKGKDYWTGGLNPGLLWIWANSARPLSPNSSSPNTTASYIQGTGRCLKLAYSPPLRSYKYRGMDCGLKSHFICEHEENSTSRALERIAKSLKHQGNSDIRYNS